MSSRTDITPLSITNGKISNQAKIDPRKLAPAKEGQVLIAGKDGKFLAGNLPTTTVTNTVTTKEEVLPPNQIKIGPNTAEPGATNQFVNVGAGEHSIPRRDSNGNLKAETADRATNADQATNATNATNADNATNSTKLNNQEASFYTDVANHTGHATAYEYTSLSNVSQSPSTFTHNLGYIPDVTVYQSDGQDPPSFSEIDATVKSTTTTTDVTVSEGGVSMKVIIK